MNISIFGLGYVGCISLGCLAEFGMNVIGVDINDNKVDLINKGLPTIVEKDIDHLISRNFLAGRISATKSVNDAIKNSNVSIICVGTPSSEVGHLELSHILQVAMDIALTLKEKNEFHLIVIRSTVLPGTNEKVSKTIEESSGKKRFKNFDVVSNPEFLREGSGVYDFLNPSYTIIGTESDNSFEIMKNIYANINAPLLKVDIKVAELIKYINNSFHALKITFANEVGNICKNLGIDAYKLMDIFCMDNKLNLSPYYLKPGYAYGGSCLPKDLRALNTISHDLYLNSFVLGSISLSNEYQKELGIKMVTKSGKRKIGVLGLSFKPGTDDLRYSPMVELVQHLIGKGYFVLIYDKNVSSAQIMGSNKEYISNHIPNIEKLIIQDCTEVIENSEVIIINHTEFDTKKLIEENPNKLFIEFGKKTPGIFDNRESICG